MSYEFLSVFFEAILIIAGFIIIFFIVVRRDANDKEIDKLGQYSQRVKDYERINGYDLRMRKKLLSDKEELKRARDAYEESLRVEAMIKQEHEKKNKKGMALLFKYQDIVFDLFSREFKRNNDGCYYPASIIYEDVLFDAFKFDTSPSNIIEELTSCGVIRHCRHDARWYELDTTFLYINGHELNVLGVNYSKWIDNHFSKSQIDQRLKPIDFKPYEYVDDLPF